MSNKWIYYIKHIGTQFVTTCYHKYGHVFIPNMSSYCLECFSSNPYSLKFNVTLQQVSKQSDGQWGLKSLVIGRPLGGKAYQCS